MAYYGSGDDVRYMLSGGVREGHPQYLTEDKLPEDMIEMGRRFAYRKINSILKGTFGDLIPYASGSEPEILYEYANTISAWWINGKRNQIPKDPEENSFNTEYAEAIEALKEMAKTGKGLDGAVAAETSGYFTHDGYTPIFDLDDVESHVVDGDLEDRISDERA